MILKLTGVGMGISMEGVHADLAANSTESCTKRAVIQSGLEGAADVETEHDRLVDLGNDLIDGCKRQLCTAVPECLV